MPPKSLYLKRSYDSANLIEDAEFQRPAKLQKSDPNETRVREALEEIVEKLKYGGNQNKLLGRLKKQPELEKQILNFQAAIRAAFHKATPFDPSVIVQNAKYELDHENHEFYGVIEKRHGSRRVEEKIIKNIEEGILQRIDSESAYDTKLEAMSAIVDIISVVSPMQTGSEWAGNFQTESLPRRLVAGLLKLGNMMADEEIERLSGEKDVLAKLEVAREAEYSCQKRCRCINQFLNLCADGSKVLNFDKSLQDFNAIIAKALSTSNYGRPEHRGFQSSDTERAVVSLLEEHIFWKIHLRSPYQTKLNAFKVLTRIGHAILQAQKEPYADSFQNTSLETIITDIMLMICDFTNQGFATSSYESYLIDREFVSDILEFNVNRQSAFPGLPLVLQELKIFSNDCESGSGQRL